MASQQVRSVLWQGETQGPSVAVSPDDRLLAILTSNHVDIWDTAAAKYAAHLDGGKPPRFAEFSRDGSSFAFYHNWDGAIVVYDTAAWHEMARVSIPFQSSFDVSPDHSLMALSDDSSTSILDVTSDEQIRLLRDDLEYAQALVFTPDGRLLLAYDVIGGTGLADAWETSSWERVGGGETLWTHGFARGQFADDGRTFLSYQWLEEIALYGLP
jgi:WD40 repeat protein